MSDEPKDLNKKQILGETRVHGRTLYLDIWYPRSDENIDELSIGLMDVRAADDIKVSYDFDRDGWVIKQASTFEWSSGDTECDMDWQEVAFIKAWGRQKHPRPEDT